MKETREPVGENKKRNKKEAEGQTGYVFIPVWLFCIIGKNVLWYKNTLRESPCGGSENCRRIDPPQAEKLTGEFLFYVAGMQQGSSFFAWYLIAETFLQRLRDNLNTILSIETWSGFYILGEERQILQNLWRGFFSLGRKRRNLQNPEEKFFILGEKGRLLHNPEKKFCILGRKRRNLHKLRRRLSSVIDKFWFLICRKYIISCRRRRGLQAFPKNRRRWRNFAGVYSPRLPAWTCPPPI